MRRAAFRSSLYTVTIRATVVSGGLAAPDPLMRTTTPIVRHATPAHNGAPGAGDRATRPPGVVFLIHDLRVGGAERVFIDLVNGIEAPRPIPVLVRAGGALLPALRPDRAAKVLPGPGSDPAGSGAPLRGPGGLSPAGPWSLWRKVGGLLELARDEEAVVVSTFLHKSHVIGLCAKRLSGGRLRVVLNAHEHLTQHLVHQHRGTGRWFYRGFARRFFRHADLIVAVAEGVADDLIEHFEVPRERVVVSPNPVDVDRLVRLSRETPEHWPALPDGASVVLGVGRLARLKGFDLLIRAMARLPAHLHAHLVLVGDGVEGARLDHLAERLGLSARVHRVGVVDNPWAYMARAGVVAVPSRTEALPNVIGEAQALGVPVVGADCSPGVREALEDGAAGILVPPEEPEALAGALVRGLEDDGLRRRLVAAGRRRVAALGPDAVLSRYSALLESVASGGAAADVRGRGP